jgi:competence protein ComEA
VQTIKRIAAVTIVLLISFWAGAQCATAGSSQEPPKAHSIPAPEARIDINHASIEELLKVPGMTRSWAGRIVRFRPYHAKNELLDRGVVSDQVYGRIKDYVIAHREKQ